MKRWVSTLVVASLCVGCGGTESQTTDATTPAETAPAEATAAPASTPATAGSSTAPVPAARPAARPASTASAAVPATAAAPTAPTFREVTLPAGTTLRLQLQTAVASDASKVEDEVRAELREAVAQGGEAVLPAGTVFVGTMREVERSGRVRGRARVAYRFETLTRGGERYDVNTALVVHEAQSTRREDATKVAIGAGAGAALGAILGGGDGAAKGAAIGAAGGTGVVLATRGDEVRLEPGASINTTLDAPLTVRVRVN